MEKSLIITIRTIDEILGIFQRKNYFKTNLIENFKKFSFFFDRKNIFSQKFVENYDDKELIVLLKKNFLFLTVIYEEYQENIFLKENFDIIFYSIYNFIHDFNLSHFLENENELRKMIKDFFINKFHIQKKYEYKIRLIYPISENCKEKENNFVKYVHGAILTFIVWNMFFRNK